MSDPDKTQRRSHHHRGCLGALDVLWTDQLFNAELVLQSDEDPGGWSAGQYRTACKIELLYVATCPVTSDCGQYLHDLVYIECIRTIIKLVFEDMLKLCQLLLL
jgi:hypothetical protein